VAASTVAAEAEASYTSQGEEFGEDTDSESLKVEVCLRWLAVSGRVWLMRS
jgi:hypothetical protein